MKTPEETITDLVNCMQIEEVPETAVSDKGSLVADQMAVSIAISLKRIADALDGTTDGVDITDSLVGSGRAQNLANSIYSAIVSANK